MAEGSRFGDALMLLGMGMQGNSQGISNYFAAREQAKAEAEKQKRLEQFVASAMGQGGNSALQQLAPLVMAGDVNPSVLANFLETPESQLDMQLKRAQLENMGYEAQQRTRAAARDAAVLGTGGGLTGGANVPANAPESSPMTGGTGVPSNSPISAPMTPTAFEQLIGAQTQSVGDGQRIEVPSMVSALQQLGVDPTQPTALPERLDIPRQPLTGQPQAMPQEPMVTPIEPMTTPIQQTPQQSAQPMTIEQFRETPQGRAFVQAGDAEGLMNAYNQNVKAFYDMQREMIKPQQERETLQKNKEVFSGAVDEIRNVYKAMKEKGSIPTAEQDFVKRAIVSQTSSITDPANRQILDGYLSRLRLSLMQATNMSTQVFNSNVEMQALMKALSSPDNTFEANMAILDSLEKQYGAPKSSEGQNQQQPQRYKEGDVLINPSTQERIILRNGQWQKL